jgi:hypothetical protein
MSVSTGGDGRFGKKFVVHYAKTHGKLKGLPCVSKKCTANSRVCRASPKKRTTNHFSRVYSLCRVPYIKHTAKKLFVVRPTENARQTFSRTAKLGFLVVTPDQL